MTCTLKHTDSFDENGQEVTDETILAQTQKNIENIAIKDGCYFVIAENQQGACVLLNVKTGLCISIEYSSGEILKKEAAYFNATEEFKVISYDEFAFQQDLLDLQYNVMMYNWEYAPENEYPFDDAEFYEPIEKELARNLTKEENYKLRYISVDETDVHLQKEVTLRAIFSLRNMEVTFNLSRTVTAEYIGMDKVTNCPVHYLKFEGREDYSHLPKQEFELVSRCNIPAAISDEKLKELFELCSFAYTQRAMSTLRKSFLNVDEEVKQFGFTPVEEEELDLPF